MATPEQIAAAEAVVAGFADVSDEDKAYWADKLGSDLSDVGNPEAAQELANWLEIERTGTFLPNMSGPGYVLPGTPRYPVSAVDLRIGFASAKARAAVAGVTAEQLVEAQRILHDRYGASLDGGDAPQNALGFYGFGTTEITPDGVQRKPA